MKFDIQATKVDRVDDPVHDQPIAPHFAYDKDSHLTRIHIATWPEAICVDAEGDIENFMRLDPALHGHNLASRNDYRGINAEALRIGVKAMRTGVVEWGVKCDNQWTSQQAVPLHQQIQFDCCRAHELRRAALNTQLPAPVARITSRRIDSR